MRFLIVSFFALLFAASPAAAQTPVTDSTFIIAYIDGLPAGWAKLVGSFGDQSFLVDSARIDTKGRFMLRRKPPLKPGYYYFILPEQKNFAFLIEEERKIIFRGNAADLSNTLSVEGCPNADATTREAAVPVRCSRRAGDASRCSRESCYTLPGPSWTL